MTGRFLAWGGDRVWGSRTCCFALHRCAPAADWGGLPNQSFYMNADYLDRMLTYVVRSGWTVVTMEAAMAGGHRRQINFSVDDGYRDTVEQIMPIFRRHGLPVTLYITTGIPDGTMLMWQSGLETIIAEQDVLLLPDGPCPSASAAEKRAAYAKISAAWDRGDPASAYSSLCAQHGYDLHELRVRHAIDWPMLERAKDDPLVEIGAHTISHPHVAALPDAEASREIGGSGERLRQKLGVACRHFAFPFGQRADCGPRDFRLARDGGFASAATTHKGLLRPDQDPYCVPRNIYNGKHQSTFLAEAHLVGATGVAAHWMGHG